MLISIDIDISSSSSSSSISRGKSNSINKKEDIAREVLKHTIY